MSARPERRRLPYLLHLMLLAPALLMAACAGRPPIPVGAVPPYERPADDKVRATRAVVEHNLSKDGRGLYSSGPDHARVDRIVRRIAKAAGSGEASYPVYVVDSGDEVNAMAVNDNTIVVYRTLLQRVKDDNELATVISHEVAHILAKHGSDESTESRRSAVSVGSSLLGVAATVGAVIAGVDPSAADLAGDATEVVTTVAGEGAFVRSYDRQLEYEADHIGLMLMGKAGYDPNAALRFWGRAAEIFGGDSSGFAFLSTHPSSDDRMDSLRAALPKALEYYQQSGKKK